MKQLVFLIIYVTILCAPFRLLPTNLSAMEALDIVREKYAPDFTKTFLSEDSTDYFYKWDKADYYLVYEEANEITGKYLFRLYEFVVDDPDTGTGHTVTYGFYWVDPYTGEIEIYE